MMNYTVFCVLLRTIKNLSCFVFELKQNCAKYVKSHGEETIC